MRENNTWRGGEGRRGDRERKRGRGRVMEGGRKSFMLSAGHKRVNTCTGIIRMTVPHKNNDIVVFHVYGWCPCIIISSKPVHYHTAHGI